MTLVEEIIALFARRGQEAYLGEPVSQLEHALQAAWCAEQEGASAELITAALLHDIGHLLDERAEDPSVIQQDLGHEATGARWLAGSFSDAVLRPIELHVPAKRYLCATEPNYFAALSDASKTSLRLQGGPMSAEEADLFRRDPHAEAALRLRRWDERAKIAGLPTPSIEHFRKYLEMVQLLPAP